MTVRAVCWKVPYPTRAEALRALRHHSDPKVRGELHAYQCGLCRRWHLGHPIGRNGQ